MKIDIRFNGELPSDISIFCNNCIGGCVCHDFGLRFNSPTVNLIIKPTEYIEFLSHIEYYKNKEIEDCPSAYSEYSCPVGIIDNKIKVYFLHYKTFEEAKEKWISRCARINLKKIYFVMAEKDGCTDGDLLMFEQLAGCKKKIAFVHKRCDKLKDTYIVASDSNNPNEIITLTDWKGWLGKREYDVFDWRTFLS
jgi:uncharacterized protein (DUF1919 family)